MTRRARRRVTRLELARATVTNGSPYAPAISPFRFVFLGGSILYPPWTVLVGLGRHLIRRDVERSQIFSSPPGLKLPGQA